MRFSLRSLGGLHFGNLHKVYGEYRFAIAPNEQRPFHGFFKDAFVNVFKDYVLRDWYHFAITGTGYILLYKWCINEHKKHMRKDPKDFENDV